MNPNELVIRIPHYSYMNRDNPLEWKCPICKKDVVGPSRIESEIDRISASHIIVIPLPKSWICDKCASPEEQRRRILFRQFSL